MPVTVKRAAKTGQKPDLVRYPIYTMPINRRSSDIKLWRSALRNADLGRYRDLYELYEDLTIDAILSDAVSKRTDAVANSELVFRDATGQEVPEIADIIESQAFETLLKEIISVKFWGRAGVEFDFRNKFAVNVIPRRHLSLETESVLFFDHDLSGQSYVGDPFILALGDKHDKGLFLKTAPLVIYKRGGFGDWAQFVELFGMPHRVGKYNAMDPESRQQLVTAMKDAGSAPYVVIPDTASVDTINNTGTQNSATYNDFRRALNEEILISILGQTMTTTQGDKGARSLGEVHQEVEQAKHKSDLRFTQRILNERVLPMLEARGYPVKGGKFVFPKSNPDLSVDEVVNLSTILPISQKFLYEKYGIPTPEPDDDIAGAVETGRAPSPNNDPANGNDPGNNRAPKSAKIAKLSTPLSLGRGDGGEVNTPLYPGRGDGGALSFFD